MHAEKEKGAEACVGSSDPLFPAVRLEESGQGGYDEGAKPVVEKSFGHQAAEEQHAKGGERGGYGPGRRATSADGTVGVGGGVMMGVGEPAARVYLQRGVGVAHAVCERLCQADLVVLLLVQHHRELVAGVGAAQAASAQVALSVPENQTDQSFC